MKDVPEDPGRRSRETAWLLAAGATLVAVAASYCVRPLAFAVNVPVSRDEPAVVGLKGGTKPGYAFSFADRVEAFGEQIHYSFEIGIVAILGVGLVVLARPTTRRHLRVAYAVLLACESLLLIVVPARVMVILRNGTEATPSSGETWFWSYVERSGPTVASAVVCAAAFVLTVVAFSVLAPTRKPEPEAEPQPERSPFAPPDFDEATLPSYVS